MARELLLHGVAELREGSPTEVAEVLRGVLQRVTITAEPNGGHKLNLHLVARGAGLLVSTAPKMVRTVGLEPTSLAALGPKPSAYANSAMSARMMIAG